MPLPGATSYSFKLFKINIFVITLVVKVSQSSLKSEFIIVIESPCRGIVVEP
jgi:hypothetical protein